MKSDMHSARAAALTVAAAFWASLASAAPPAAQTQAAPARPVGAGAGAKSPTVKAPPNFDAILGVFDKMFPAQADPDPARLALARTSVQAMWPDGAYGQMMTSFMGGMFDRVMQMRGSDFAPLDTAGKVGSSTGPDNLSIHDKAIAKDPNFDRRMAATREILNEEMVKISAVIDPRMREGLARAMARRLDARQLTDINAFFATPSGHALAAQYMQLWLDPDTMRSLVDMIPEMMKLMPEMSQKLKAVNEKFPKPKSPAPSSKGAKN